MSSDDKFVEVVIARARGLLSRDINHAVAPITSESMEIFVVARGQEPMEQSPTAADRIAEARRNIEQIGVYDDGVAARGTTVSRPTVELFRTPKTAEPVNPTFNETVCRFSVHETALPITLDVYGATFRHELFLGRGHLTEELVKSRNRSMFDEELRLELTPRDDEDDPVIIKACESFFTGLGLLVVQARLVDPPPPPEPEPPKAQLIEITVPKIELMSPKRRVTEIPKPSIVGLNSTADINNTNDGDDEVDNNRNDPNNSNGVDTLESINNRTKSRQQQQQKTADGVLAQQTAPAPPSPPEPLHVAQMVEIAVHNCTHIVQAWMSELSAHAMLNFPGRAPPPAPSKYELVLEAFGAVFSSGPLSTTLDDMQQQANSSIPVFSVHGSVCAAVGSNMPVKLKFVDCWNAQKQQQEYYNTMPHQDKAIAPQPSSPQTTSSQTATTTTTKSNKIPSSYLEGKAVFAETVIVPKRSRNADHEPTSFSDQGHDKIGLVLVPHPDQHSDTAALTVNGQQHHGDGDMHRSSTTGKFLLPVRFTDKYRSSTTDGGSGGPLQVEVSVKPVLCVPAKSVTESSLYQGKGLLKIEVREARDLLCMMHRSNLRQEDVNKLSGIGGGGGGGSAGREDNDNDNDNETGSVFDQEAAAGDAADKKSTATASATNKDKDRDGTASAATSRRESSAAFSSTAATTTNQQQNNTAATQRQQLMPPEPLSCEVAIKDNLSDKEYKLLGRSPVVMPEEDAFFGFTTTVELEQLRKLPEAIIVSIFQGPSTCIAKSVIRVLGRRAIDGTWVTLKPPVKKGHYVSSNVANSVEGMLQGMLWVRWVASCAVVPPPSSSSSITTNRFQNEMQQFENEQAERGMHRVGAAPTSWIARDSLIPELIRSSNTMVGGGGGGGGGRGGGVISSSAQSSSSSSSQLSSGAEMVLQGPPIYNVPRETGAFCLDWNSVPVGQCIKISQQRNNGEAKTVFGPALRCYGADAQLRSPPVVVYLEHSPAPLIIETFRCPENGAALVVSQRDRVYEKKCWLPSSSTSSQEHHHHDTIHHQQDDQQEHHHHHHHPPPCFSLALDEIASVRVPCRWVPLLRRIDTPPESSGPPTPTEDERRRRKRAAEEAEASAERDSSKAKDRAALLKKKYQLQLLIRGQPAAGLQPLPCTLEENETLEKIQPFVEKHFGIAPSDQVFQQGRMKLVPSGRPQPGSGSSKQQKSSRSAGGTTFKDDGTTEVTVTHRDIRAIPLTVKLSSSGVVVPLVVPYATTVASLRALVKQAVLDRALTDPQSGAPLAFGPNGVYRLCHLTKILRDDATVRNLSLRPEVPLLAMMQTPEEAAEANNQHQQQPNNDEGVDSGSSSTAANNNKLRRPSDSPAPTRPSAAMRQQTQNQMNTSTSAATHQQRNKKELLPPRGVAEKLQGGKSAHSYSPPVKETVEELKSKLSRAEERIRELEETVQRQQGLLRRVADSFSNK